MDRKVRRGARRAPENEKEDRSKQTPSAANTHRFAMHSNGWHGLQDHRLRAQSRSSAVRHERPGLTANATKCSPDRRAKNGNATEAACHRTRQRTWYGLPHSCAPASTGISCVASRRTRAHGATAVPAHAKAGDLCNLTASVERRPPSMVSAFAHPFISFPLFRITVTP